MEHIKTNLEIIRKNIASAAAVSKRKAEDITLVAVTKTIEQSVICRLPEYGCRVFGENRVQELLGKYGSISGCSWHMIGNLQKNKIKYIIDKVSMIQSVNSIELAAAINEAAKRHSLIMEILLEVNIADEETKHGINPSRVQEIVQELGKFDNISLRGLMAIPPFTESAEGNRKYFQKMYKIYVDICNQIGDNKFSILSMGMSGDYAVAVEEGATMVRIGTGIFKN